MMDRIQSAALRSTLRRAVSLGLDLPFSYQQLDQAADELAQQLNDEAALRQSAEHALEVVAEQLRGGDVDGALAHIAAVLAERQLGATPCEGFAASWCPNCGTCTCSMEARALGEYLPTCQLHSDASSHAEAGEVPRG